MTDRESRSSSTLCQVTLTRKSKACGYLGGAPFTVNILAADQAETALHFAGRPQPSPPVLVEGPTAPQLVGNAATISCRERTPSS